MKRAPKVGALVRWPGNAVVGPCDARVLAVYPLDEFVSDGDDDADRRPTGRMRPESEWSVALKPDVIPTPWAYTDHDKFAAQVGKLEAVK